MGWIILKQILRQIHAHEGSEGRMYISINGANEAKSKKGGKIKKHLKDTSKSVVPINQCGYTYTHINQPSEGPNSIQCKCKILYWY